MIIESPERNIGKHLIKSHLWDILSCGFQSVVINREFLNIDYQQIDMVNEI